MKFSDDMRFAHPILSPVTKDFGSAEFIMNMIVDEKPTDGELTVEVDCQVTDADVEACVKSGVAAVGLFVTCGETYFNQLRQLALAKSTVIFPAGVLRGRVTLRPIIWLARELTNWRPKNLHPEFGMAPLNIGKSKLLGIGQEFIISVGREKLAPMESIFTLAKDSKLQDGEVSLDLETARIRILLNDKTFGAISHYRSNRNGRPILLNGLYFPVVMEVLRIVSANPQVYEQHRWYRPFTEKCTHFQIRMDSNVDPLPEAQRLLSRPLKRLVDEQERLLG